MRQSRETKSTRKSAENALPGFDCELNFNEAKKNSTTRKRTSKALSKAHRKIDKLQGQNKKLQTKSMENFRREFSVLIHHQRNQKSQESEPRKHAQERSPEFKRSPQNNAISNHCIGSELHSLTTRCDTWSPSMHQQQKATPAPVASSANPASEAT
ncbi:hypothetical protein OS493_008048 [Desmophyllum pertusum]|uniref:Uncharacterized protein n=1 Tax=Desmophyllum pertusum TaxID=174260 RepID=A0A9W9YF37_9CNID|nr:hypothetical protein OS493_008048 [Desmophyllum pertusum]